MRLVLLTEIPAPFRIPLWNALAALPGIDLRILFLSERDPRRTYELRREEWLFDSRVLRGRDAVLRRRWVVLSRSVRAELRQFAPDLVVVGGWNQPAFLQAVRFARRRHVPLVLWVESTARDERSNNRLLELLKGRLIRAADGFLVPGRAAGEYLRGFGVGADRIAVAPNAVDENLARQVAQLRGRRDELRAELGLRGCTFLSVSRLSREKGVDLLVGAFEGVPGELVVVGGGAERDELQRRAPKNVRFLGPVPRSELPRWYAAADVFVLASRSETWGMALTEAAAAGLPLVASEAVGAAYDLIEPSVNGLVVRTDEGDALREALRRVAVDEPFRKRGAARSLELGRRTSPRDWAEAVAGLAQRLTR
jgi:glycosyltransferase involved in cell wall biosynthesis